MALPKIKDLRGNLSFFEEYRQLPWRIQEIRWYFEVPSEELIELDQNFQLLVVLSGNVDILIEREYDFEEFRLNTPSKGLLIQSKDVKKIKAAFSSNSVLIQVI